MQPGENITYIWLHSYATLLCRICMASVLQCSVFRVFHIGIITTSYNSYFVLATFCPFRVRVGVYVNILGYIQDRHSRRSRNRFYLYSIIDIFYKMFHGVSMWNNMIFARMFGFSVYLYAFLCIFMQKCAILGFIMYIYCIFMHILRKFWTGFIVSFGFCCVFLRKFT